MTTAHREAYTALARADNVMQQLAEAHGTADPFVFHDDGRTARSNFAAMTLHILGQQISTKVAFVLYDRLTAATGSPPTPAGVLRFGEDQIRQLGTTRSKAVSLCDLARRVHSGDLPIEHMATFDDEEAVGALARVKGVGVWTAQMFLIHQLHRRDILPAGYIGIRHAIRDAYELNATPTIEQVRDRGIGWSPNRTYAAALLWRTLHSGPNRSVAVEEMEI
jgi:DNA-3-methyladenine glycosylase II